MIYAPQHGSDIAVSACDPGIPLTFVAVDILLTLDKRSNLQHFGLGQPGAASHREERPDEHMAPVLVAV